MKLRDYVPPIVAAAEPDTSTIAMVAVYPLPEEAEALAIEGGLEPEDLHCTLVFLGDLDDLPEDEVMTAALAQVALELAPLAGNVGGVGRFAEGPDGVPVLALPDVQGLTLLRERVVDELGERGVRSPSEHGFLPHMTLTYMAAGEEVDLEMAEESLGRPLTFGGVSLVLGDERYDYELTGARVAAAGMHAVATADELTAATQRLHEGLDDLIGPLASAYESVLRAAGRRIANELRAQATSLTADPTFLPPDEDEVMSAERLAREIAEDAADATRQASTDVAAALEAEGIAYDVGAVFTDDMLEAVGERTAFAADEQLRSIYRDVITAAGAEGWSINRTADAIVDKVDGVAAYRATAMARTDLIGLANAASLHAAQLTAGDQVLYKNWLATADERTRPTHWEAHGQSVYLLESFTVGGAALQYPGDPFGPPEEVINCRCTLTYGDAPGSSVVRGGPQAELEPSPEVADPLANVAPTDAWTRQQAQVWDDSELLLERGTGYARDLETKLASELAAPDVDVRVRSNASTALQIARDGRFKSQYETRTSGGAFSPAYRAEVEAQMFGYRETLPDAERPIYGYVGGVTAETGMVRQYGDVVWVMKSGVRDRATWTFDDSLGSTYVPSPMNRPSYLSVDPAVAFDPLAMPMRDWDTFYTEAQIHGGLSVDDVARVEVRWGQMRSTVPDENWRLQAENAAERLRALLPADVPVEVRPYDETSEAVGDVLRLLGRDEGESGFSLGDDGSGINVGPELLPVATSEHADGRHLGPEVARRTSEHAHLGRAQGVALALGEEHEVGLASLRDHSHASDDTSLGGGSRPSEGLPLHAPNEEGPMSTTVTEPIVADAEVEMLTPVGWDAVLCVEGEATEDGRGLERGAIAWRDLPLTLMGMLETGAWGHEGAKVAGRIDAINRIADELASSGELTSDFGVNELAPLIADRTVRGVSVDLAVLDYEYRDRNTNAVLTEEDLWQYWIEGRENEIVFWVLDGTIVGATVCPMPAIANAEISLAASAGLSSEGRALLAAALEGKKQLLSDVPIIKVFTPFDRVREGLFAAGAVVEIADPPRAAFELTEFPGNTPFTVTEPDETGWRRVFGHLATWDTCHVGIPGTCTTAPRSYTDPAYALFHQHQYPIAEGGMVDVGVMMLGTGHASLGASRMEATRHYDKPDMIGAYVRAYDGEHGIWVSGVARDTLTPSGLRELRTNPPSGDWRQYNGRLELIAACAVAVPGFPVVASAQANIVAAGGLIEIDALIASAGEIVPSAEVKAAMIAAGCACDDAPSYDEGIDDLAELSL